MKLGIDIGGVLATGRGDPNWPQEDTMFGDGYLNTPMVLGAISAVKLLLSCDVVTQGDLYIISKCGPEIERKSTEWLKHKGFFHGVFLPENLHFCRARPEKASIAKELGLNTFIDDRLEVLYHMQSDVPDLIAFQPSPKDIGKYGSEFVGTRLPTVCQSWFEVIGALYVSEIVAESLTSVGLKPVKGNL